eukprot:XP_025984507.1 uncharacterized protein LOC100779970 [Glycine max]
MGTWGQRQLAQDIIVAAVRACRDAIATNSIPAFHKGSIPGVTSYHMKLHVKLGVPHPLQQNLDKDKINYVFPYGRIMNFEVVDGGLTTTKIARGLRMSIREVCIKEVDATSLVMQDL